MLVVFVFKDLFFFFLHFPCSADPRRCYSGLPTLKQKLLDGSMGVCSCFMNTLVHLGASTTNRVVDPENAYSLSISRIEQEFGHLSLNILLRATSHGVPWLRWHEDRGGETEGSGPTESTLKFRGLIAMFFFLFSTCLTMWLISH